MAIKVQKGWSGALTIRARVLCQPYNTFSLIPSAVAVSDSLSSKMVTWILVQCLRMTALGYPTNLCTPRDFLKQMYRPFLMIIKSFYFVYRNKQNILFIEINKLFTCCLRCSRDQDVLRAQMIIDFFIVTDPLINEVRKSNAN